MNEVSKALEMGYVFMNVFEIWEYEVTFFDRDINSGCLYSVCYNMFLQLKQESSGYTSLVQSEA